MLATTFLALSAISQGFVQAHSKNRPAPGQAPEPPAFFPFVKSGSITIEGDGMASNGIGGLFRQTSGFIYENTRAWNQHPDARIQNVPSNFDGKYVMTTSDSTHLDAGVKVKFHCPSTLTSCNIVIFYYECFPCSTFKGGLTQLLSEEEFIRTRCAPTFTLTPGGVQHRMTGYVKTIPSGDYEIVIPDEFEYAVFGLSKDEGRDCSSFDSEYGCLDDHDFCLWKAGQCVLNKCIVQGPSTGGCDLSKCPPTYKYTPIR